MRNELAGRLQILHAGWIVNSGTLSGDKYADDLADAMLDDAETIIDMVSAHTAQSAELAALREENERLCAEVNRLRGLVIEHRGLPPGFTELSVYESEPYEVVQRGPFYSVAKPAMAFRPETFGSYERAREFTAALGEQGQPTNQ